MPFIFDTVDCFVASVVQAILYVLPKETRGNQKFECEGILIASLIAFLGLRERQARPPQGSGSVQDPLVTAWVLSLFPSICFLLVPSSLSWLWGHSAHFWSTRQSKQQVELVCSHHSWGST